MARFTIMTHELNQEPWQKWFKTNLSILSDGEEGGGGGGAPSGNAPADGAPSSPAGGGGESISGPAASAPTAAGGADGTPAPIPAVGAAPVDQAAMWREQADYMRGELQRTTAALQQVLRQQQSPPSTPGVSPSPQDLFNIDEKELANLHPAVQAMFRAMKELHENVGGIKTQFDQTTQATTAAQEARQLKETETALNTHIDTVLESAGLPKGGTLTNMVGRVSLQSLKNLHSQGYAITRSVIDSVVGDLVSSIKQDMASKQPALPPHSKPGGGGNPQLPAVPTAADRKAALTAAISSMNMED